MLSRMQLVVTAMIGRTRTVIVMSERIGGGGIKTEKEKENTMKSLDVAGTEAEMTENPSILEEEIPKRGDTVMTICRHHLGMLLQQLATFHLHQEILFYRETEMFHHHATAMLHLYARTRWRDHQPSISVAVIPENDHLAKKPTMIEIAETDTYGGLKLLSMRPLSIHPTLPLMMLNHDALALEATRPLLLQ